MRKKILALSVAIAAGLPIFAAFYMCVKLNGDIINFEVEDIEEVLYEKFGNTSDSTSASKKSYMHIKQKNGDSIRYDVKQVEEVYYQMIADTNCVDISDTPLRFNTLTDSTVEVSGIDKKFFVDEDGTLEEKEVKIPTNVEIDSVVYKVTGIGKGAFSACSGLSSIEIPYGVTYIGEKAFNNCKGLKNIEIPSSMTLIGEESFQYCSGLKNITIPSSVARINEWAFYGCTYLDVVIENSKENVRVETAAFDGCKSVTYTIESPIEESDSQLKFAVMSDSTAELTGSCTDTLIIPDTVRIDGTLYNVTSISQFAFAGCDSLKIAMIPNSITFIGQSAFLDCVNLDVVIDNSEDNITAGDSAFLGCKSVKYLREPIIPEDTTTVDPIVPTLKYKILGDSTVEVTYNDQYSSLDTIIIPDTVRIKDVLYYVESIGDSVFAGCRNLKAVVLPSSLRRIGIMAFSGCDSMTTINIPENVAIIDEEAFDGCKRLTDIMIPNGMTKINFASFANCKELRNIEIPESVTIIDRYAFANCDSLNITINNSEDDVEIGEFAFDKCHSVTFTKESTIPNASDLAFSIKITSDSTAEVTKSNASKVFGTISIPERVRVDHKLYTITNIGASAFDQCTKLTSVTIPESVTTIEDNAFNFCTVLTSIEIPSSVTTIGESAFSDCTNLRNLEIPGSVISIGKFAFAYCKNLSIVIKNTEENIEVGDNAFIGVKSVKYQE